MNSRMTIEKILAKKKAGQKITMLTAYDYPFAKLIDSCGIDIILVGDSLANVVLGLSTTREVGLEQMIYHAKAVNRAVEHSLLVGDMPFESYQVKGSKPVENAKRFINEAGCNAVKLEWFEGCAQVAREIIRSGVPVMGHVGLTPQTADRLGGFKLQGNDVKSAEQILSNAVALEKTGCFSVVLECVPQRLAETITQKLKIPTIGIGAGINCDGQVLVLHDILGLFDGFHPKFAKRYVSLGKEVLKAVNAYKEEVLQGKFPDSEHSFKADTDKMGNRPH